MKRQPGAWFWLLLCWLALLYVPDLGRGFLKDDFRWIAESRITSVSDVWHASLPSTSAFIDRW